MVKGLVLYDYDGTLVDERDEIYVPTQLTKAAISRLQDLGYLRSEEHTSELQSPR